MSTTTLFVTQTRSIKSLCMTRATAQFQKAVGLQVVAVAKPTYSSLVSRSVARKSQASVTVTSQDLGRNSAKRLARTSLRMMKASSMRVVRLTLDYSVEILKTQLRPTLSKPQR